MAGGGRAGRGAPAPPRTRRPRRHPEVRAERRARHPRAGERPRDRRPRGRRRARQGVPARARRSGLLARDPDHLGERPPPRRPGSRGLRRRRRVAGALSGPRGDPRDGRRDQRPAQGQRIAGRRVRGAGLRPRARTGLARVLARAPRRGARPGGHVDPGRQGRGGGRRHRGRRAARITGPRRDLLWRATRLLSRRPIAPGGSRAV